MFPRRSFLQSIGAGVGAAGLLSSTAPSLADVTGKTQYALSSFRFDVTPPAGHSLCGGWIKPVEGVDDELEAIGFVLHGGDKPIVLCAVDWTGLLNDANRRFREVLAAAAGTTPDRVAVHCVHQHNAPFACLNAQDIVGMQEGLPHIVQVDFFEEVLERAEKAVRKSLDHSVAVTHIATGAGQVEKVASNRRIHRDENGVIVAMRGSSCRDPKLRAMTEGTIDPQLRTIAYYSGPKKIAACHYYATHPMSYYGDGRVTSDFTGLARKRMQRAEPDCCHIYFTGCAGNISAGKYNDGSKEQRPILAQRIFDGMAKAAQALKPVPLATIGWKTAEVLPTARDGFSVEELEKQIQDDKQRVVNRNRPAYRWAWMKRLQRKEPLLLSSLQLNDVATLHMPAESFIEYQLRANKLVGDRFLATAAYGDGGPWYIPTADEYPAGGYEVSVAFSEPTIDEMLTRAMKELLL
jgi:hypothetical protein